MVAKKRNEVTVQYCLLSLLSLDFLVCDAGWEMGKQT
jgi:hypothetical protein